MAEQHRATAGQWASVKASAHDVVTYSTILELRDRIKALEAKDEDDKEAWAARLRRPGRSQAERISSLVSSLVKRIEALENDRRAVLGSGSRLRVGLDTTEPEEPNQPAKPDSSLKGRVAAVIQNGTACDRASERIAGDTIREVAAWFVEKYGVPNQATYLLEKEAER